MKMMTSETVPRAFPTAFWQQLETESYTLMTIGLFIIGLRTYARIRKLGFRNLQADDYVMLTAVIWYVMTVVGLNGLAQSAGTALAGPGEDVSLLSDEVVAARAYGAKITFMAEQGMLNVIWTLKACMLIMYGRLTLGARNHLFVRALSVYTLLGWIACQLTLFLECRPFKAYWQIKPSPNLNCMVYWSFAAVQCSFNISSDIAMLFIPLPMIVGVKVHVRQKLILLILFSMGLFVIAAAILTKVAFWKDIYDINFMYWYIREASVAVYVSNLPCIWPLLREMIPGLKSVFGGTTSKTSKPSAFSKGATAMRSGYHGTVKELDDIEGNPRMDTKGMAEPIIKAQEKGRQSDEHILLNGAGGIKAETTIEMSVMDDLSDRQSH
ncbi:hypothetical protein CAC42_6447 [Sphaceloma murrayae]|uniref:Rhodopsin domain-containing protein n=1 Tax=Sphaceloma murrayae TaxID=2082308 RepID=A0A2K1QNA9_9PEZI|nr:hypothetical protein CAC42_6447 [Sphaceloma murrayae]